MIHPARTIGRAAALSLAIALGGCTADDGRQQLVVYSPHGPDLLEAFEDRFEAANPEIDLQWLDMGSQEVLDRIRSERANPQADVWFGGPSQLFLAAAEDGLLQAYQPGWSPAVGDYADPQGRFHSIYLTPLIIAYNSEVVDSADAPQDWDDAFDPRWTDEVLIRDPVASGTMRTIFGMVLQRAVRETGSTDAGFQWLGQLDDQTREYVLNPTLLYQKLARQEGLVTFWDMPDIEVLRQTTDYPISYLYASSGTPLVEDAIALVQGAPHPEAGQRFIDFIGSEEEVAHAAQEFFRLPARSDIDAESLPPTLRQARDVIRPEPIDWQMLYEEGPDWMRYWDENVRGR